MTHLKARNGSNMLLGSLNIIELTYFNFDIWKYKTQHYKFPSKVPNCPFRFKKLYQACIKKCHAARHWRALHVCFSLPLMTRHSNFVCKRYIIITLRNQRDTTFLVLARFFMQNYDGSFSLFGPSFNVKFQQVVDEFRGYVPHSYFSPMQPL